MTKQSKPHDWQIEAAKEILESAWSGYEYMVDRETSISYAQIIAKHERQAHIDCGSEVDQHE